MEEMTLLKVKASTTPRRKATPEWIAQNRLQLIRTPEEVLQKILQYKDTIQGQFYMEVLFDYINYEDAKREGMLNPEAIEAFDSGEEKWIVLSDINETAQDFLDYMLFAWDKAYDERGLSASRSTVKLSAWLWLMGREDLVAVMDDIELYPPYGIRNLIAVCKEMAIEVPEWLKTDLEQKIKKAKAEELEK